MKIFCDFSVFYLDETLPKGSVVVECGKMLRRFGYRIKIFNTINFKKSMHYNPFAYIHSEKDILKLVTCLISNTKGDGKSGDEFWQKAETLLYCALIGYIHYEAPVEEQNFATLIEMLNSMEVREDDEEFENAVDLMFKELSKEKPDHFAVRQYAKYRLAAGKTLKSILVSCGARLAPFDIEELREVTAYDELELDTLGDRKTALFLIMSDTDASFNFLISMIYSQLFNLLCEKADDVYGGRYSRSCLRRLGKKRLIHSTPARVEGVKRHIRSITRNSARSLPAWMSWQFWMAASASSSFAACARSCLRNMTSPSIRITNTSRMPTGATRLILKSFSPPSSK